MATDNELTITCAAPTEVSGCDGDENHIQNGRQTQGKGEAAGSEWTCRFCGKEDSKISSELARVPDFSFLRSHCSKKEVNLAKIMRIHAAYNNHMPLWNFANIHFFIEKRSEAGSDIVDMIVDHALVKSSALYSYEDFTEFVSSTVTVLNLHAYVALRFGGCRRMLHGCHLNEVDTKISKIKKWKEICKRKEHHGSLWPALRLHFRSMQRAITANWETIAKTDHATLYQLIQDVFVGNHYLPSLMYTPSDQKRINHPVGSPFRVAVCDDDPFIPKAT